MIEDRLGEQRMCVSSQSELERIGFKSAVHRRKDTSRSKGVSFQCKRVMRFTAFISHSTAVSRFGHRQ